MARTLTVLGVVLVVAGAVVLIGPTFGFSTLAADRAVDLQTADGPGAFVGLDAIENVEIEGQNDPETVITLENNLPTETTYTFDATIPDGLTVSDESDIDPGETLTLGTEDEPAEFILECDGPSGEQDDSAWVSLTVEEASAGSVQVYDATAGTEISYDCPGRGGADIEVGNVEADGGSVTFDITNTGTSDFRINEFAVDHSESNEILEIVADGESESPQGNEMWATDGELIAVGSGNSGLANVNDGETITIQLEFDVDRVDESFEFTIVDNRGDSADETMTVDVP